jgi:hypothetical protein
MESMALSLANGIDPETGQPTKPLFDPITRTFNQDVADQLISRFPTVGADIVKTRLESVQGIGSLQEKQAAKKQEEQAQEKSKLLFKEDGTIDQNVYIELMTNFGQAGLDVLEKKLKGVQGVESLQEKQATKMQEAQAREKAKLLFTPDGAIDKNVYIELMTNFGQAGQNAIDRVLKGRESIKSMQAQQLSEGLYKEDGTLNLTIVAELRKTPEGRKILEENAPKTISVKDDETIVTVPVWGEASKVIRPGKKPDKYSSFAQKLIEAGLTPNTEPFQRRMLEHINAETKGAGKGTGNVTIGGITIDTGEAGKAAAKVIGANVANIENQFTLEKTIKNAVDLVDKGIYAGAYGPEKGALAKYSLGTIGDKKKVENTEVFMSYIGETVIPRLQEFGGNDSNEELAYLQKVMGGNLRLEPEAIRKILINTEKKVQANIKRLQKQAEGGQLSTQPIDVKTLSAPKVTKRFNPNTGKLEPVDGE